MSKAFLKSDPTVFISCKHSSDLAVKGAAHLVKWFNKYLPQAKLLAVPELQSRLPSKLIKSSTNNLSFISETHENLNESELIVSCGGDGTLLHISSLFQNRPCPPVLPFSLGSLGFLSSFDFSDHKIILNRLFKDRFTILPRQRLLVEGPTFGKRVILNELFLNRSTNQVPEFEFCLNDDDNYYFPSAIADSLIFANSTGSTGHSLSAGGPLLHPTLDCGVLSFLAPRTLASRPLILPIPRDRPIIIGLCSESRAAEVDIHLDGSSFGKLKRDEHLNISKAEHPFPVFSFFGHTADWNNRLSRCIHWNQPYENTSKTIKF